MNQKSTTSPALKGEKIWSKISTDKDYAVKAEILIFYLTSSGLYGERLIFLHSSSVFYPPTIRQCRLSYVHYSFEL